MPERTLPAAFRNSQFTVGSFHLKRKPDTRRKDLSPEVHRSAEKQGKMLA
jgi:hypothetical protein